MSSSEPTSVFTDDSGSRARTIVWIGRGLLGLLALGAGAVAFSLVTQVTLPGLDGPVHLPGAGSGGPTKVKPVDTPSTSPTDGAAMGLPTGTPTAGETGSAGSVLPGANPTNKSPNPVPSAVPTATTAPTPSKGASRNVRASEAPRANPTHTPGTSPTVPPGKAK